MSAEDHDELVVELLSRILGRFDAMEEELDVTAKALLQAVAKSITDLQKATPALEQSIERQLGMSMDAVREEAVRAAREAAESAVHQSHARSIEAARNLSQAAGEARMEAWRYFGGFWVWLASVGALGAILGAVAIAAVTARADAKAFGKYPGIYCEVAGGTKFTDSGGTNYCAVPLYRERNPP